MPSSKVLVWNGVASTDVAGLTIGPMRRDPLGEIRSSYLTVPGKEGAWMFPQPRGTKILEVECFVEADDKATFEARLREFANWLDVEGEATLALGADADTFYYGALEDATQNDEWRNTATYTLTWRVQPYLLDAVVTTEAWTADDNDTHVWDPDVAVYLSPVIVVTPTNGTLTKFELDANGETLTYTGSIASGQSITINGIASVIVTGPNGDTELTGAYNPSLLAVQYMEGTFPILAPGGNNTIQFVKLGGTATAINISVSYRKRYRR